MIIKNKIYNIVFASDDWYAQQLCVAIYSTLLNFSKKDSLSIYVLDSWISDANKKKILGSCKQFWVQISFVNVDCSQFKKYANFWYNEYAFARLFVEDVFVDFDKILYLDCDIVVDGDLAPLMDIDVSSYSAWVVSCEFLISDNELNWIYKHIGVWNPLFGSWVMLINLNWRRDHHVLKQSQDFLDIHWWELRFMDQDILNHLLHGSVLFLPPKYNSTGTLLYSHFYEEMVFSRNDYLEAKRKPVIIHFAWWSRPWTWDCFNKWNKIWWKYQKQTLYSWWKVPAKYFFKLKRYKFLLWHFMSNIIALFWYKFYCFCIEFWRKYII